MATSTVVSNGLDGIVVAETTISEVDGTAGRLTIKGHDVEELAQHADFEQTCHLLWHGKLANDAELSALRAEFGKARVAAHKLIEKNPFALERAEPMDALRTCTSLLDGTTGSKPSEFVEISAAIAVFVAHWHRRHQGKPLIQPDPSNTQAEDFLHMLGIEGVTKAHVDGINAYLTTVSDHGMNASTFTCRVVASTASDNVSCVVAAIGALKGPLHGGAPGPVLEMLSEIGSADKAAAWVNAECDADRRIMGMGHRVYQVRDPRAAVFEHALGRLEKAGLPSPRLTLARQVEKTAEEILAKRHPNKPLKANVEFYTAVLLDTIGIPQELFTPTFAIGRVAGWLAHAAEQRQSGRLIRPASNYIGPKPTSQLTLSR